MAYCYIWQTLELGLDHFSLFFLLSPLSSLERAISRSLAEGSGLGLGLMLEAQASFIVAVQALSVSSRCRSSR
jgi:hypothetical protein